MQCADRTTGYLVGILEALVLLVRHGRPHLRVHVLVLLGLGVALPLLVHPDVVQEQHEGRERAGGLRGQHGDLGRLVLRRIPLLEGLGGDDVCDGESTDVQMLELRTAWEGWMKVAYPLTMAAAKARLVAPPKLAAT